MHKLILPGPMENNFAVESEGKAESQGAGGGWPYLNFSIINCFVVSLFVDCCTYIYDEIYVNFHHICNVRDFKNHYLVWGSISLRAWVCEVYLFETLLSFDFAWT